MGLLVSNCANPCSCGGTNSRTIDSTVAPGDYGYSTVRVFSINPPSPQNEAPLHELSILIFAGNNAPPFYFVGQVQAYRSDYYGNNYGPTEVQITYEFILNGTVIYSVSGSAYQAPGLPYYWWIDLTGLTPNYNTGEFSSNLALADSDQLIFECSFTNTYGQFPDWDTNSLYAAGDIVNHIYAATGNQSYYCRNPNLNHEPGSDSYFWQQMDDKAFTYGSRFDVSKILPVS